MDAAADVELPQEVLELLLVGRQDAEKEQDAAALARPPLREAHQPLVAGAAAQVAV
jgi:hypothetical protein